VKADSRISADDELRLPPQILSGDFDKKELTTYSQTDHDFIASLILYEDDDIIALNKPAGLAVQGGSKIKKHIDGLLQSYQKKGVKPRLVHRLDKETSGVLLLAKSAEAARNLTKSFQTNRVKKTYLAVTCPSPAQPNGTINAPLSKASARRDGGDMMVHDEADGKHAVTNFEVLDQAGHHAALVAFYPVTGRTHQIRVHAAIIGAPLLGDTKYNDNPYPEELGEASKTLHLHARHISFSHPITWQDMTLTAPLPSAFMTTVKSLGFAF
jgi:23S rRNA pseudouridine955/2504/2580 synthase